MEKAIIGSHEEFEAYLGKEIGITEWFQVDQERINKFAEATLDYQWIHVDVERAKALDVPISFWGRLQNGEEIEYEGKLLTPDMVLGPDRKGIKLTYCTDSRPCDMIVKNAEGSDLFICEGMYGEPGMEKKAKDHKHMTFYEAADMAKRAGVKELWLTHYSPSLNYPKEYEKAAQEVFSETYTCKDGKSKELNFED